jgi:hypothetical protein
LKDGRTRGARGAGLREEIRTAFRTIEMPCSASTTEIWIILATLTSSTRQHPKVEEELAGESQASLYFINLLYHSYVGIYSLGPDRWCLE